MQMGMVEVCAIERDGPCYPPSVWHEIQRNGKSKSTMLTANTAKLLRDVWLGYGRGYSTDQNKGAPIPGNALWAALYFTTPAAVTHDTRLYHPFALPRLVTNHSSVSSTNKETEKTFLPVGVREPSSSPKSRPSTRNERVHCHITQSHRILLHYLSLQPPRGAVLVIVTHVTRGEMHLGKQQSFLPLPKEVVDNLTKIEIEYGL